MLKNVKFYSHIVGKRKRDYKKTQIFNPKFSLKEFLIVPNFSFSTHTYFNSLLYFRYLVNCTDTLWL